MKSDEYCHSKTDSRHFKLAIDWLIDIDLAGEYPPLMGKAQGQLLSIQRGGDTKLWLGIHARSKTLMTSLIHSFHLYMNARLRDLLSLIAKVNSPNLIFTI